MASWFKSPIAREPQHDSSETLESLPASWYRSSAMYQFERRAIFSQRWLLVSHQARFEKPGDFVQITEANITFFLIKDRKGTINAHHNVCRHRAYPLVEDDAGRMKTLACKYHGWSYGFDGKLAKAPKYDETPNFDKEKNSLFSIHVHVDNMGFMWVNLDSEKTPEISWTKDFAGVDLQPRFEKFDMSKYRFDHQWEMVGEYNWKVLAENYNECYHCPTGHPGIVGRTDLSKYWVETSGGHIQHFNVDREDCKGLGIYSTYYYPNASMTISSVFFYIMRVIPISATRTKMEYEVYRHEEATDEDFMEITSIFRQVLKEDKDLCTGVQKNLDTGVFVNGELHPRVEKGPRFFQGLTREIVKWHHEKEERLGSEIWRAKPRQISGSVVKEDIDFCAGLECMGEGSGDVLAW